MDVRKNNSIYKTSFLQLEDFEKSFIKFDKHKAQIAYSQSLHLIDTLVKIKGTSSLSQIIESVSDSNISSDGILSVVDLDFEKLYIASKKAGETRLNYPKTPAYPLA